MSHLLDGLVGLYQDELKTTLIELGQDTGFAINKILQVFIDHYKSPGNQLDVELIYQIYSTLNGSFLDKYKQLCQDNEVQVNSLFHDIKCSLDDLKESATKMMNTLELSL